VKTLVTVAGMVVAIWGAIVCALIGAFLTPFRIGGTLIPIAIVVALVANFVLVRFTYFVTGNKLLLSLVPGVVWLIVTVVLGSGRTTEGDLVLSGNNWVASVYLVAGPVAVGFAAYRLITPRSV
jgi:hypothetical protein